LGQRGLSYIAPGNSLLPYDTNARTDQWSFLRRCCPRSPHRRRAAVSDYDFAARTSDASGNSAPPTRGRRAHVSPGVSSRAAFAADSEARWPSMDAVVAESCAASCRLPAESVLAIGDCRRRRDHRGSRSRLARGGSEARLEDEFRAQAAARHASRLRVPVLVISGLCCLAVALPAEYRQPTEVPGHQRRGPAKPRASARPTDAI